MSHETKLLWMHEGIVTTALPSARGRRRAALSLRGELIALGAISEEDYSKLIAAGRVYTDGKEGRNDPPAGRPSDNGRGAGTRAARRPRVGLVSGHDTGADKPTGA